jgi:hypothetical protein
MKKLKPFAGVLLGIGLLAGNARAQTDSPYKILDTTRLVGSGGTDYVFSHSSPSITVIEPKDGTVAMQIVPEELRTQEIMAAKIPVQGARYPEHLQKLVGR